MEIGKIKGATRTLAVDQPEYDPIDIRDAVYVDENQQPLFRAMEAIFHPTAEEIVKIMSGEPIRLSILGTAWPPVMLNVGDDYSGE